MIIRPSDEMIDDLARLLSVSHELAETIAYRLVQRNLVIKPETDMKSYFAQMCCTQCGACWIPDQEFNNNCTVCKGTLTGRFLETTPKAELRD